MRSLFSGSLKINMRVSYFRLSIKVFTMKNTPKPTANYDTEHTLPARKLLFQAAGKYLNETDLALLERACAYAFNAHESINQKRKSGEPYITHPIAVATKLANWRVDVETLCAALMHDVIEDVDNYTKEMMIAEFGETIADIVDGVSKLENIFQDTSDHKAANFRKLIMAATKDVRVILVKISDRLHNMQTLDGVKPHKRVSTAKETLQIYAPIANRLGLNSASRELQDLSFQHTHPLRYHTLQKAMTQFRKDYADVIHTAMHDMQQGLVNANIEAQLIGRERNIYNIYTKMQSRQIGFDDIKDIYNFTVIVNSTVACYTALGVLHSVYKPSFGKIRDYIANPKANGYQSLHTELLGPYGLPIKVQIRSRDMHAVSRFGIMAQLSRSDNNQSQIHTNEWLRSILDFQKTNAADDKEFFEYVTNDLFANEIYVRTPKGKAITLPRGATVLDFAYAIHTDVGNRCVGAKINNIAMPLRTTLKSNDLVEIITSENATPNPNWLNIVISSRARTAIRNYIKNMARQEASTLGQNLLQKALTGLLPQNVLSSETLLAKYQTQLEHKGKKVEDVYFEVGSGYISPVAVAMEVAELAGEHFGSEIKLSTINVNSDIGSIHFGQCCNPIPNDAIRAQLVRGKGLIIHRETCKNLLKSNLDMQLDADWDALRQPEKLYDAKIHVSSEDRHGLLAAMTTSISNAGGNIAEVETLSKSQTTTGTQGFIEFAFLLNVRNTEQLNAIINELNKIPSIRHVKRI